jgi:hypothetical protein
LNARSWLVWEPNAELATQPRQQGAGKQICLQKHWANTKGDDCNSGMQRVARAEFATPTKATAKNKDSTIIILRLRATRRTNTAGAQRHLLSLRATWRTTNVPRLCGARVACTRGARVGASTGAPRIKTCDPGKTNKHAEEQL